MSKERGREHRDIHFYIRYIESRCLLHDFGEETVTDTFGTFTIVKPSQQIHFKLSTMGSTSQTPHVLILGGGLGGLTLAQSLRKKGLSYQIFERDSNPHARLQGWAIALHS